MLPFTAPVVTTRVSDRRAAMSNPAVRAAISIGFRSRPDEAAWHFCENCLGWPDAPHPFEEWSGPLPAGSEICVKCLELRKVGNCRLRAAESGFLR